MNRKRRMSIAQVLLLVVVALTLGLPAIAQAANVVPNPGFEQGGCGGNTPSICGWELMAPPDQCGATGPCTFTSMYADSNAHTGSASMFLSWSTDFNTGFGGGVEAATDPAFCAQIGPGAHPASFWSVGDSASLNASFYQGADCTGAVTYASPGASETSAWNQTTGVLVAPPGTQSALFSVSVFAWCDYAAGCSAAANFDDLDVEDTVLTTPVITSFTPASGRSGTSVDIQGANFSGATSVTFAGAAASFTVDSDSEIHVTVPGGATTGPISVTTPNGTITSSSSFGVPPTINSFTPTCGPAGATIDILGSNFTGATSVTFSSVWYGRQEATFTVDSDSEIHAIVPSAATFGSITVGTPGGTDTSSSPFTGPCNSPPVVNSLTPNSGPVGTSVDIGGHYFTGATSVKFNGIAAAFTVDSDSEMHATVPSGATSGPVSVTTPNGTTWNLSFTVTPPPPTISSFTPTSGPVGTSVDVVGSDFTGATSVAFNGTASAFTVNSDTEIHATVPSGATTGPIAVTTQGGTATSSSAFSVVSDTRPPETTISSGPSETTPSTSATFGFTASEPSTFECSLDAAAFAACTSPKTYTGLGAGSHSFRVRATDTAGNTDPTPAEQTWTIQPPAPSITSFSPTGGAAGSTVVTVNGSNLVGATAVTFNGLPATFSVPSGSSLRATVPNGATSGPIAVTTPGGQATSATAFAVTFTISGFAPASGPPGTAVIINGTGFSSQTKAKFNGTAALTQVISSTQLRATVPTSATSGPISVVRRTKPTTTTSPNSFTVTGGGGAAQVGPLGDPLAVFTP